MTKPFVFSIKRRRLLDLRVSRNGEVTSPDGKVVHRATNRAAAIAWLHRKGLDTVRSSQP